MFSRRPEMPDILGLVHTVCATASFAFLLCCSITSPALKHWGFLYYDNIYHHYSFGVLGYCNSYLRTRACTTQLGYSVYGLFQKVVSEGGQSTPLDITYSYLTKYLVLVPIATVVAFAASVVSVIHHRRGRILLSTAILSTLAFCFTLPSLIMEELLFNQLAHDVQAVGGATVSRGVPRYLLILAAVLTALAAGTGYAASRRERRDPYARSAGGGGGGLLARGGGFDNAVPMGPYANLDKQAHARGDMGGGNDDYGQHRSSLLAADGAPARGVSPTPSAGAGGFLDPAGTYLAFDSGRIMPSPGPSPAASPAPHDAYANPYDGVVPVRY